MEPEAAAEGAATQPFFLADKSALFKGHDVCRSKDMLGANIEIGLETMASSGADFHLVS